MNDKIKATEINSKLVVLGGTSDIAIQFVQDCMERLKFKEYVLIGRRMSRFSFKDFMIEECDSCSVCLIDISDFEDETTFSNNDILEHIKDANVVMIAYGSLSNQDEVVGSYHYVNKHVKTNFSSVVIWLEICANLLGHNTAAKVIVLGSVAGDRGRASNYLYGACKGALEIFVSGLRQRSYPNGPQFSIIKLGFVETKMTKGIEFPRLISSNKRRVSNEILKSMEKDVFVAYVPSYWRWIMLVVKILPTAFFLRLKF